MRDPIGRVLLRFGLLAGSMTLATLCVAVPLLDPHLIGSTVASATDDPAVRSEIEKSLRSTIGDNLGESTDAAVAAAFADPRFKEVVEAAVTITLGGEVTGSGSLTEVLNDAAANAGSDVRFAESSSGPVSGDLELGVGAATTGIVSQLPEIRRLTVAVARVSLMTTIAGVLAGLLIRRDRGRGLRTIGRWAVISILTPLFTIFVIPRILRSRDGIDARIAGLLIEQTHPRLWVAVAVLSSIAALTLTVARRLDHERTPTVGAVR